MRRVVAWLPLLAVAAGGWGCAAAPGYRAPRSLTGYAYVVLATDSVAEGVAAGLTADGLRVWRELRGTRRGAGAVLVFPFEDRYDVRVVDTRSGHLIAAVTVERHALPERPEAAGRALAVILAQAIRHPPEPN